MVVVTVHVADSIVVKGLFEGSGNLWFFFGKDSDHIGDYFAIEVCYQFEVGLFPLHQILHLKILVFGEVRVSRSDLLGHELPLHLLLLTVQSTYYHVLHLQLNPLQNPHNLLVNVPLPLLPSFFN